MRVQTVLFAKVLSPLKIRDLSNNGKGNLCINKWLNIVGRVQVEYNALRIVLHIVTLIDTRLRSCFHVCAKYNTKTLVQSDVRTLKGCIKLQLINNK